MTIITEVRLINSFVKMNVDRATGKSMGFQVRYLFYKCFSASTKCAWAMPSNPADPPTIQISINMQRKVDARIIFS